MPKKKQAKFGENFTRPSPRDYIEYWLGETVISFRDSQLPTAAVMAGFHYVETVEHDNSDPYYLLGPDLTGCP